MRIQDLLSVNFMRSADESLSGVKVFEIEAFIPAAVI